MTAHWLPTPIQDPPPPPIPVSEHGRGRVPPDAGGAPPRGGEPSAPRLHRGVGGGGALCEDAQRDLQEGDGVVE
eukprot:2517718-Alexandrium_andersonii.AAC.1